MANVPDFSSKIVDDTFASSNDIYKLYPNGTIAKEKAGAWDDLSLFDDGKHPIKIIMQGRFEGNAFTEFPEWPGKAINNYVIMFASFEDAVGVLVYFKDKILAAMLEEIIRYNKP